jgi:hypothetical protein
MKKIISQAVMHLQTRQFAEHERKIYLLHTITKKHRQKFN